MKKVILLGFLGTSLWIFFVSASSDLVMGSAPAIKIGADGSLPTDGSQCVPVDAEGIARVNFISPPQTAVQGDDGFDYDRYGFYLSVISADHGRFPKKSSLLPPEASLYQEVISSENAGKTICFKLSSNEPVPSWFEVFARYFGLIATLRALEGLAGAAYKDFLTAGYPGSIPAITMLHNQLEMGKDVRQLTELNTNASSVTSGLGSAVVLSAASTLFPASWYTSLKDLSTVGSFTLFYAAPIGEGYLIAIDDKLATRLGELISPANGTERQPGSRLISHAFRGPAMMASLYGSQNYWPALEKLEPNLMVSLTIVTSYSTRTFVRELSNIFLENGELLGYVQDGLLMISIASTDDPSTFMSIYFDENFKGRTNELVGSLQQYSARMNTIDENAAWALSLMGNTIIWTPVIWGLLASTPYTAPAFQAVLSYMQASLPLFIVVGMQKARQYKNAATKDLAKVGHSVMDGLATVGKNLANLPGLSHTARLRPRLKGSGMSIAPKTSAGKALGLSFAFNTASPTYRSMVHYLSQLMTDIFEPGCILHQTFQTSRQFVIGHYVLP